MPHGIRILRVAPAQRKSTEIVCAEYALTLPAAGLAAVEAYNAGAQALVEKKTKRGRREVDLKTWLPTLQALPAGDGCRVTLRLPCACGEGDNINPSLLLGYFSRFGIEPWQCEVLRDPPVHGGRGGVRLNRTCFAQPPYRLDKTACRRYNNYPTQMGREGRCRRGREE